MLVKIKESLEALRVNYDCWFSESSLYENGQYDKVMAMLKQSGYIAEKESAHGLFLPLWESTRITWLSAVTHLPPISPPISHIITTSSHHGSIR